MAIINPNQAPQPNIDPHILNAVQPTSQTANQTTPITGPKSPLAISSPILAQNKVSQIQNTISTATSGMAAQNQIKNAPAPAPQTTAMTGSDGSTIQVPNAMVTAYQNGGFQLGAKYNAPTPAVAPSDSNSAAAAVLAAHPDLNPAALTPDQATAKMNQLGMQAGTNYMVQGDNIIDQKTGQQVGTVSELRQTGQLSSTTTSNAPALSSEDQQIKDNQTKAQAESDNFQSIVKQYYQGTLPLTMSQQNLVNDMTTHFNALQQQQELINKNYNAGVTSAANISGLAEYSPVIAMGQITNAMNEGLAKIQTIQSDASKAINEMVNADRNQNFDALKAAHEDYQNSLDKITQQLQHTADKVQEAKQFAQDQQMKQQELDQKTAQDNIQNTFKSIELSDTQKKQVFDEAMQSANFTEKQKQDIKDDYFKQQDINIKQQQVGIQQADLRLKQQKQAADLAVSNETNALAGNVFTTTTGKQYADASQYKIGSKEYNNARLEAAAQGMPFVDKATALGLQGIDTARLGIKDVNDYVHQFLPADAQGRITAIPSNKLSQYLQTNDQLAAYDSLNSTAITALKGLIGGGGLRITGVEVQNAINNYIPKVTDTIGTADQKLKNLNRLLTDKENTALVQNRSTLINPDTTRVISPDGTVGSIPKDKVQAALKAGYKLK